MSTKGKVTTLLLVFACAVPAGSAIQEATGSRSPRDTPAETLPPARVLQVFSRIPLSVPPFGYYGVPQCDASGRMFFETATPPQSTTVYLSISADGENQVVYNPPKDAIDPPHNTSYYASSNGDVHLLVMRPGHSLTWFRFDSSGKLQNTQDLSVPTNIHINSFAVTNGGYLLLLGYYPPTGKGGDKGGPTYRAIFNPNGKLVTTLAGETMNLIDGISQDAVTASGENFYWTAGDAISVMDTNGDIVRRFEIVKPSATDMVASLRVSDDLAEVQFFDTPAMGHPLHSTYLVMNAWTGDPYASYLPPEGGPMNLTCFDKKQGFTFLEWNKSHLTIVRALLP